MYISRETPEQTDSRLRKVMTKTDLQVLQGDWWFDEFHLFEFGERLRSDAVALIRDADCWSQLVPALSNDRPQERLRVWRCHFPNDFDNSGFIGWLASRIKTRTGSGIFVTCGQNSRRGGIYDYAGCPIAAADAVLAELQLLRSDDGATIQSRERTDLLDTARMRVLITADDGAVSRDTLFTFTQRAETVSAHYAGGSIRLGQLVGTLTGTQLSFRYVQVDLQGRVDSGMSSCELRVLADGRLQLHEHFQWESRPGSGTNVLEEVFD